MKRGKKLLSLFLAVAIAVSGINFAGVFEVNAANEGTAVGTVSPSDADQVTGDDGAAVVSADIGILKQAIAKAEKKIKDENKVTSGLQEMKTAIAAAKGVVNAFEVSPDVTVTKKMVRDAIRALEAVKVVVSDDNGSEKVVDKVEVTPGSASLRKGGKQQFTANVTGRNLAAGDKEVTWAVSSTKSTISATGELTVAADETAETLTVTATSKTNTTKSGTATVTVISQEAEISGVTVAPATVTVAKKGTQQFTATVEGTNLADSDKEVTWTVSGTKSNIDATGKLTVAEDETEATLTVTATSKTDDTKSGTATVTVQSTGEQPEVTGVGVTPKTAEVEKGKTQQFTATVEGTNLADSDKEVTWTVSGGKSTIDATGKLTVAADETAATLTVTATSKTDDAKSGTATVTVKSTSVTPVAKVTSVTVAPKTATVEVGKTQQFTATVQGTDLAAADKAVTWTVSGGKSTIDATGKLTVAANETAASLTVTATSKKDTSKKDTAVVTVKKASAPAPFVKVTKVTITNGKSIKIAAGKKVKLAATVAPKNASNKAVTWSISSKDKKYATLKGSTVTTKKAGAGKKIKVTALAKDGSKKKATITITIMKNAVTKVSLKAKKTVKAGKKITVKATVKTNGKKANKTLKWSLDKKSAKFASVNKKGVVTVKKTAKKGLKIKVTATATDGSNKKGTITIKVVK